MIQAKFSACLLALFAICAPTAYAHRPSTGGAAMPDRPQVRELQCGTEATATCPEGELLRLKGENLDTTKRVVFLGARGGADNHRVTPSKRSQHRVVVRIPADAPSGRVRAVSSVAGKSRVGPRVTVTEPVQTRALAAPAGAATAFPVRGKLEYGTYTNRYGGGRNHQGQDVFAKCGTTVASALPGEVTNRRWQSAAGNYVVIQAADGTSQAYMHLIEPASVKVGQEVAAGQPIGRVGQTGRASGCHLHFEFWTAPGWYMGGKSIDPLPKLRQWERADRA
jgi:murein DD-endopeptidase MepM/ murein hydrolase activator NlpD